MKKVIPFVKKFDQNPVLMCRIFSYSAIGLFNGGNSPQTGFDCSGLMQWGYGTQGIKLPRTSQDQYTSTTRIERKALQPGDLVFFKGTVPGKSGITHVGMYIGDNKFYNASNSGVGEASLNSTYWSKYIAGYGRVK
ncbi:C40 family peptidase [Bacillus paramycoides]|uniref:C40 family peptidase n=1 Tax=Bacillus paramycoides TaxID=2026194 RepID=UPI000AFED5B4|nr:NlpC/P60 family protein [Bacillus paramycoides]